MIIDVPPSSPDVRPWHRRRASFIAHKEWQLCHRQKNIVYCLNTHNFVELWWWREGLTSSRRFASIYRANNLVKRLFKDLCSRSSADIRFVFGAIKKMCRPRACARWGCLPPALGLTRRGTSEKVKWRRFELWLSLGYYLVLSFQLSIW